MKIRDADSADAVRLAELAAARAGGPPQRHLEAFGRELATLSVENTGFLLVAEVEGVLAGYARARYFQPDRASPPNAPPEGWYLTGVMVSPDFRRLGIGTALTLARLDRIGRSHGEAYYFANTRNLVSIAFHGVLGFVEVARDFAFPGVVFEGGEGILFRASLPAASPGRPATPRQGPRAT